jgi:hypothetical protein
MLRIGTFGTAATLLAHPSLAEAFARPIPQAQSATAEFWFALAALAFIASLWAVHWLVTHR